MCITDPTSHHDQNLELACTSEYRAIRKEQVRRRQLGGTDLGLHGRLPGLPTSEAQICWYVPGRVMRRPC